MAMACMTENISAGARIVEVGCGAYCRAIEVNNQNFRRALHFIVTEIVYEI